jgi:hypothetical protein
LFFQYCLIVFVHKSVIEPIIIVTLFLLMMRKLMRSLKGYETERKSINSRLVQCHKDDPLVSAATWVFHIEELFIVILESFVELCHTPEEYVIRNIELGSDIRALIQCRRVCRRWNNLITTQKRLQVKTFMKSNRSWPWNHPNPALLIHGPEFGIVTGTPLRHQRFQIVDCLRADILQETLHNVMNNLRRDFLSPNDRSGRDTNNNSAVKWRNMLLSIHGTPLSSYSLRLYPKKTLTSTPIFTFDIDRDGIINLRQNMESGTLADLVDVLCSRLGDRFWKYKGDWRNYNLRDAQLVSQGLDKFDHRLDIFVTQTLTKDSEWYWQLTPTSSMGN